MSIEAARAIQARVDDKLARLRSVEPFLIDLSLRENPVGARVGQTLADKQQIVQQVRDFGFQHVLLGTLDYSIPDEPEVDDDFLTWVRDSAPQHLSNAWVFTEIGYGGPSRSMEKYVEYRVPNTLLEIYLSETPHSLAETQQALAESIAWIKARRSDALILVNIVDGCDAFFLKPDDVYAVLRQIAGSDVLGLSFEDDRGTFLPFQVGGFVEIARAFLRGDQKILVHMHTGAGMENASLIEALLAGADGVWGGLPKRAAIIGHASLGELIANLARIGNPMRAYRLEQLVPFVTTWQTRDDQHQVAEDDPVTGRNAYRTPLEFFAQTAVATRAQTLPPERVGATQRWRVCPVVSDATAIQGRLREVLRREPVDVFTQMIRLMRQALRQGRRIAWDEPDALVALYQAAGGT